MGADIYDWDRVHGKGSYQELVDAGCYRGQHQAGCSHGVPACVAPGTTALEAAWQATAGMFIEPGKPYERAQRAQFIATAVRAAWDALGKRAERDGAKLAAIAEMCREKPDRVAVEDILAIIGTEEDADRG